MKLSNQGYTFEPLKTNHKSLRHKTNNFNEAIRGYDLELTLKTPKSFDSQAGVYKRKIVLQIPASKLLIPVEVLSKKNFRNKLRAFEYNIESSVYSVDKDFFPSYKEFAYVFRGLVKMENDSYGGYFRLLGDKSLFFLRFEFSQDFHVFKLQVLYESLMFEHRLSLALKQLILLISDFYV